MKICKLLMISAEDMDRKLRSLISFIARGIYWSHNSPTRSNNANRYELNRGKKSSTVDSGVAGFCECCQRRIESVINNVPFM